MTVLFRTFEAPPWKRNAKDAPSITATIGNFDGVHSGHKVLLGRVAEEARKQGAVSLAMSFYPHPAVRLGKAARLPQITSLHQKIHELGKLGLGYLCHVHFTSEFSALSASEFIDLVLIRHLNIAKIILGPDASVGRNREGTPEFISKYFEKLGRKAEIISAVESESIKISSRMIRDLLSNGEIKRAAELLGRRFAVDGRVARGAGRGATIGIPTANLASSQHLLPKNGVYATRTYLDETWLNSITNIGVRPTFGGDLIPAAETHILGQKNLALYGRRIEIEFVERIRDEKKFAGKEELVTQIKSDISQAEKILERS